MCILVVIRKEEEESYLADTNMAAYKTDSIKEICSLALKQEHICCFNPLKKKTDVVYVCLLFMSCYRLQSEPKSSSSLSIQ